MKYAKSLSQWFAEKNSADMLVRWPGRSFSYVYSENIVLM